MATTDGGKNRIMIFGPKRGSRAGSIATGGFRVGAGNGFANASVGLQANDHIVESGDVVFRHACKLGYEGIVSKQLGLPYRSGRSRHWIKS